jgi:hypothetical protein
MLSEEDTSICDTDPANHAIRLRQGYGGTGPPFAKATAGQVPLAKRFDAAA